MAEQTFQRLVQGRNIALIAPARYTQGAGKGEWIDSHDLVVRLNWGVPVPDSLHADLGSRSDILYKRLLKLGKIDQIDVQEYVDAGLKYIVAVDRAAQTHNMIAFRAMIGDKIPYLLDGAVRRRLKQELRTSPLIGMVALRHLLDHNPRSVQLYGFDFYQTPYYDGYGGREYRQAMNRKEGTIARTHDGVAQLRALTRWQHSDPRIKFDAMLEDISSTTETRLAPRLANVIIPARAKSSRFPNKPMALINGVPMVIHVCRAVERAGCNPIVATEDPAIVTAVKNAQFRAVLTSNAALTGTDRVAEAAGRLRLREDAIVLNVQGDEPLVSTDAIQAVLAAKQAHKGWVVGAYSTLDGEPSDVNVVKVVLGTAYKKGRQLLYASRAPIPASRDGATATAGYFKQVGIYAYTVAELKRFAAHGKKSRLELTEDIEILRFLELGMPVVMALVPPSRQAVDLPEHIAIVEEILSAEQTGRAN